MEIKALYELYFSPTGATKGVADTIAAAISEKTGLPVNIVPFTLPQNRTELKSFREGDLVVVASPTYAGKLPNKILPDFKTKLAGNGAMAIGITTFGNRSFDNSLAEMVFTLRNNGFKVISAASFVTRHCFSHTLGEGRPNEEDKAAMKDMAVKSVEKAIALKTDPAPLAVPGDAAAPYYTPLGMDGKPAKFLPAKPLTDVSKCVKCGVCARTCPVGSIDKEDVTKVTGPCIKCQSCVRRCNRGAKYFEDPVFLSHKEYIETTFASPKENCIVL